MKPKSFTDDQVKIILDYIEEKNQETHEYIDQKTKNLPTKHEFFNKMDAFIGEIKANREERLALADIISRHEDQLNSHSRRIKKLENHCLSS
jgi:hypothetical protein